MDFYRWLFFTHTINKYMMEAFHINCWFYFWLFLQSKFLEECQIREGHIFKASSTPIKEPSLLYEQWRGGPFLCTLAVLAVVKAVMHGPPLPEDLQAVSAGWRRHRPFPYWRSRWWILRLMVTELRVLSATSVKFTGLPKHQAKPNLSRHRSRRGAGWKKQNQKWEEVKRGKQGG